VLQIDSHPDLSGITSANRHIMERNRLALESLLPGPVSVQGHTDLTLGPRKFSGNAQRRRRRCLLFHGTFLLEGDPGAMSSLLHMPSREPCYRQGRSHEDFLQVLNLDAHAVQAAIARAWNASVTTDAWPEDTTLELARTRYSTHDWNFKW
jgi:lipoate-protein ligase A